MCIIILSFQTGLLHNNNQTHHNCSPQPFVFQTSDCLNSLEKDKILYMEYFVVVHKELGKKSFVFQTSDCLMSHEKDRILTWSISFFLHNEISIGRQFTSYQFKMLCRLLSIEMVNKNTSVEPNISICG